MEKNKKLKELLKRLNSLESSLPIGETKSYLDQIAKEESERFSKSFKENPTVKYLDQINSKLEKFKKDFRLEPIISAIEKIQSDLTVSQETSSKEFSRQGEDYGKKYEELNNLVKTTRKDLEKLTGKEVGNILSRLDILQSELSYQSKDSSQKGQSLNSVISGLEKRIEDAFKELKTQVVEKGDLTKSIDTRFKENAGLIGKTALSIEELRQDMLRRSSPGGAPNQQINVNSSVMSTKYADINFVSDTAIRWSATDDIVNKRVNIRASIIAGGGGGSGGPALEVNGTPNVNQNLLNLVEGTNMSITDNGDGSVTFDASGSGSPGGADTEVQFNDSGSFGGASVLTWNKNTSILALGGTFQLNGGTSGNVQIKPASVAGNWVFTLPINDGSANQVLTTDGNGITAWASVAATGGSGITRTTSVITENTLADDTASVDRVYIATDGLAFTLPDATNNLNRYTVKNVSSSVLVTAVGGDTIDGSGSVLMTLPNLSHDFISDNVNWNII